MSVEGTETKRLLKGLAFTSPWLVGFLIFTLSPILLSLYYSFCDTSTLQSPAFIGLDNYRELANDPVFWKALRNTGYYALMALPGGLIVSLGLAMLLNVKYPGQAIFRTIIFLPSLVPVVASAMVWLWLYNPQYGLINTLLSRVIPPLTPVSPWLFEIFLAAAFALLAAWGVMFARGKASGYAVIPTSLGAVLLGCVGWFLEGAWPNLLAGPGWLTDERLAMPSLAFMSLWGVGNSVVIYLAGLQDVPKELYEAAEIDGAGLWTRMWNVTLPMLSPVIFFNTVMSVIGVINVLDAPYIMTSGGPARATLFIAMYLRDSAFLYLKMGYASAMAWVLLLIVLALTAFMFWTSKRWVYYQGK